MYSVKKLANYVCDVTFWQSLFRQYCANLWNSVHKVRQKRTLKKGQRLSPWEDTL